jgi:hypothetical protein
MLLGSVFSLLFDSWPPGSLNRVTQAAHTDRTINFTYDAGAKGK